MIKLSKKQLFILVILVVSFMSMSGPVAFFLAAILSFIPAYFFLKSIRDSEKKDVEPWETLGTAFVWGALSGVFLAGIYNALGTGLLLYMFIDPEYYNLDDIDNMTIFLAAVIVAPIVEEFVKPFVMFRNVNIRKEMNEVEDGIVYGAACGLGFGATENIQYGLFGYEEIGLWGIVVVVFFRTFSSILMHLVTTSFTGYGIAKYRVEGHSFSVVVKYYLLAVLIHSAWNAVGIYAFNSFEYGIGTLVTWIASIIIAISGFEMAKRRIRELDVAGSNIMGTDIRASNEWERTGGWEQKKLRSSSIDTGDYSSNRTGNTVDALYDSGSKTPQEMASATTNWAVNFDWKGAIGFVIFFLFILSDIIFV